MVGWFVIDLHWLPQLVLNTSLDVAVEQKAVCRWLIMSYMLGSYYCLLIFLPFYMREMYLPCLNILKKDLIADSRWFLSIFSIIAGVLTKVSVTIYAGGEVVSQLLEVPFLLEFLNCNNYRSLHRLWRDESGCLY